MRNFATHCTSALAAVRHWFDRGDVSAKQLATWGGVEERTIYNYVGGATEPLAATLQLWLQRMPNDMRLHVAQSFLAGTDLAVSLHSSDRGASLMATAVSTMDGACALLKQLHEALLDGRVDAAEAERVRASAACVIEFAQKVVASLPARAGGEAAARNGHPIPLPRVAHKAD